MMATIKDTSKTELLWKVHAWIILIFSSLWLLLSITIVKISAFSIVVLVFVSAVLNLRNFFLSRFKITSCSVVKKGLYRLLYYWFLIVTVFFVALPLLMQLVHSTDTFNVLVAITWGVIFSVETAFFLYRWTYRVYPNILLSCSAFLLYTIILSLSVNLAPNLLLGLSIMSPEKCSMLLSEEFTKWFGWGVVGAVLSTVVGKASEDIWYGMGRTATGDYAKINYRFKLQRRQLLSYQGGKLTRLGSVFLCFILVMPTTGTAILLWKTGTAFQILGRVYFLCLAFAVLGFVMHQFITDDFLLRAENSYISDRKIAVANCLQREAPGCLISAWEWTSYCQVLSNIQCSRSPVFFENTIKHNSILLNFSTSSFSAASSTSQPPTSGGSAQSPAVPEMNVCPMREIIDLVAIFSEQYALYCDKEAETEKREIELQFASSLDKYIESKVNIEQLKVTKQPNFESYGFILEVIYLLYAWYIDVVQSALYIDDNNVPFEDLKLFLLLDFIKYIVFSEGSRSNICKLCWWCYGRNASKSVSVGLRNQVESMFISARNTHEEQSEYFRRVFPYLALEFMTARWGKAAIHINSTLDFPNAYADLVDKYLSKATSTVNGVNHWWAQAPDKMMETENIVCLKQESVISLFSEEQIDSRIRVFLKN